MKKSRKQCLGHKKHSKHFCLLHLCDFKVFGRWNESENKRCCFVAKSCLALCDPWTMARQAPLSLGFPRQEYWSGLLGPSVDDLPDPGIKPASPELQGRFFTTRTPRKPREYYSK